MRQDRLTDGLFIFFLAVLLLSAPGWGVHISTVIIPENSHPAVRSAASLLAAQFNLPEDSIQAGSTGSDPQEGQLLLTMESVAGSSRSAAANDDGYRIDFENGGARVTGKRPRSLLYAAGDWHLWKDRTDGTYRREPSFRVRSVERHGEMSMPAYVAATGLNLLIDRDVRTSVSFKESLPAVFEQLSERDQDRAERARRLRTDQPNALKQACHDADVDYYTFLYGNDFQRWSNTLYEAAIAAYPQIKGTPAPHSWEKASLCPSEPMTWKLIDAYLREYMAQTKADGLYVTFWDNYGIYCQCDTCRQNGLNTFRDQLAACVKQYHETLSSLGKKLIVRTWSSGVPHWYTDQWVHAPGYGHFGGSGTDLWGRVIEDLPADIVLQTKVYHADCQPDPPFSDLLGKAAPHPEIAEYQMTGQTRGRYYFPAATVDHTARTLQKSRHLLGPEGGVCLFLGGTRQTNYFLLDDILNSINVYAWRQLSWDVNADRDRIWHDWAVDVYGEKAAPYMVQALRASEEAVNRMFSTLGMGSSTNSDFARTIARRETLLMYTNRHYRDDYAKNLEPTKENIRRVIDEKQQVLETIDAMFAAFEQAKPYLTPQQTREIQTRFEWLREFAIVKRYLAESLFRFRYLRHLNAMRTTDPDQMPYLQKAFKVVREHSKKLFTYDPDQQFACYDRPLGQLRRQPALGSPVPLMRELLEQSKTYVEEIVGPDYLKTGTVADKPLYRDPVYDGATDPVLVWNKQAKKWFMFYTSRRANVQGLSGVSWVHCSPIGIAESNDGGASWSYLQNATIDYSQGDDDTFWAPEVIEHDGTYHMYVTYVPGIFENWSHPRYILHLTSTNLLDWQYQSTLELACDKVIDACVFRLDDGTWRMWYNNEKDAKSIYCADSDDLYHWQDKGKVIGDKPGEGPKVFDWRGRRWMVVDNWDGLGVYRFEEGTWTRQPDNLLQSPGTGPDDRAQGHHADVVVDGDRAWLFYFTHPDRRSGNPRRSSVQVVELAVNDGWITCERNKPTLIDLQNE